MISNKKFKLSLISLVLFLVCFSISCGKTGSETSIVDISESITNLDGTTVMCKATHRSSIKIEPYLPKDENGQFNIGLLDDIKKIDQCISFVHESYNYLSCVGKYSSNETGDKNYIVTYKAPMNDIGTILSVDIYELQQGDLLINPVYFDKATNNLIFFAFNQTQFQLDWYVFSDFTTNFESKTLQLTLGGTSGSLLNFSLGNFGLSKSIYECFGNYQLHSDQTVLGKDNVLCGAKDIFQNFLGGTATNPKNFMFNTYFEMDLNYVKSFTFPDESTLQSSILVDGLKTGGLTRTYDGTRYWTVDMGYDDPAGDVSSNKNSDDFIIELTNVIGSNVPPHLGAPWFLKRGSINGGFYTDENVAIKKDEELESGHGYYFPGEASGADEEFYEGNRFSMGEHASPLYSLYYEPKLFTSDGSKPIGFIEELNGKILVTILGPYDEMYNVPDWESPVAQFKSSGVHVYDPGASSDGLGGDFERLPLLSGIDTGKGDVNRVRVRTLWPMADGSIIATLESKTEGHFNLIRISKTD